MSNILVCCLGNGLYLWYLLSAKGRWTLDSGLDYGLHYGLNFGLDWTVASVLALLFKADYEC